MKTVSRARMATVVATIAMPIISFLGATIDDSHKKQMSDGTYAWVSTSEYALVISKILFVGTCFIALTIWSRSDAPSSKSYKPSRINAWVPPASFLLLVTTLIATSVLRKEWVNAIELAGSMLVAGALISRGWTWDIGKTYARSLLFVAVLTVGYSFWRPERALLECRPDKCSPLNGLLTSFFPQENVLALYFLVAPFVSHTYLKGVERHCATFLFVALVVSSGSRMATIATLAGLFVLFALRRYKTLRPLIRKLVVVIVSLALITSMVILFGSQLFGGMTGRSSIYGLIVAYWGTSPLIGPGRSILAEAYARGESWNFLISHEHGQLPFMLLNTGVVGLLIFLLFLRQLNARQINDNNVHTYALVMSTAVTLSLSFATEPVWQFHLTSPAYWTFVMIGAVVLRPLRKSCRHSDQKSSETNGIHATHINSLRR